MIRNEINSGSTPYLTLKSFKWPFYSRHNDDASDDEKSGKEDSKDDSKEESKEEAKKDEDEEDGEVNDPNDILEKKRNEVWVIRFI